MSQGTQHIPAWKRIGLKLKYAKDTAEDDTPPAPNLSSALGISIGDEEKTDEHHEPPSKKRKTKPDSAHGIRHSPSSQVTVESVEESTEPTSYTETQDRLKPEIPSVRMRKSVTFTPETKQEDGFSAAALFKQSSRIGVATDASVSTETVTSTEQPEEPEGGTNKKSKRERKPRQSKPSGSEVPADKKPSAEVPEYVKYLQLFHTGRDSWKFNKNKQTDLFKNIFNLNSIPAKHNEAILEYLRGLQSAGAVKQLLESTTAALKEVAEKDRSANLPTDMDSAEARRDAYIAALHRQLEQFERLGGEPSEYDDQQIAEMQRDLERGQRAEAVLGELLLKELTSEPAPPVITQPSEKTPRDQTSDTNGNISKPERPKKKRKLRTQSSPEAPSNSSPPQTNGIKNRPQAPSTVSQALRARPETDLNSPLKVGGVQFAGKKKTFDDDLLDQAFPKKPSYNDVAPKRKAGEKRKPRGFAYTHGTRADESGSEDDE